MISIYQHPYKTLTEVSTPFDFKNDTIPYYDDIEKFEHDMAQTMISSFGMGLAANQIGINKRVCVINVTRPIWLMNPTFINASPETINFNEACLSFPNQVVITKRYKEILVYAENIEENMIFGPKNMLECVCVQHEICHLNGETMFDYTI